jgi:hypothetical protein
VPTVARTLPLPRWTSSSVLIEPPGTRAGAWVGAPSAIRADGGIYLAYRVRLPIGEGRGVANVIAYSADGTRFSTVATVTKEQFDAESLERPALVRTPEGRWRLYVSAATHGTKHWRVELLEADDPAGLAEATPRTVLAGDDALAVKDPVLLRTGDGRWHLWASCHPLESWDDADRMSTWYATSPDGVDWRWHDAVLTGRPGKWDARGVRVSSVLAHRDGLLAAYDGRATAQENWEERTGTAAGTRNAAGLFTTLVAADSGPLSSPHPPGGLRYLTFVEEPGGGHRLFYEATRADGAHELRTEIISYS